jgi:uncharacterized protein (DUF1697 family)
MSSHTLSVFGLAAALLTGCASSRVVEPAQNIASAVAAFQADLSNLQRATRELQQAQASLAAGNDTFRAVAADALDKMKADEALAEASGFDSMLKLLQTRADARLAAQISPPAAEAALPSVRLAIEELGIVTQMVKAIAKPPRTRDEIRFLADFAKQTNADLNALTQDKKP